PRQRRPTRGLPARAVPEAVTEAEREAGYRRVEQVGHGNQPGPPAVDGRRTREWYGSLFPGGEPAGAPAPGQHDQPRGVTARDGDRGQRYRELGRDPPLVIVGGDAHPSARGQQEMHDDLPPRGETPHEE